MGGGRELRCGEHHQNARSSSLCFCSAARRSGQAHLPIVEIHNTRITGNHIRTVPRALGALIPVVDSTAGCSGFVMAIEIGNGTVHFKRTHSRSTISTCASCSSVAARILYLKSQMTKCLLRFMPHRSVVTAAHAEVHIPVCDLSLDITPEGGGFHYQITDLRSKCLIQTEGGLFVSLDNAKCKAAAEARNYAGGYQGLIEWTPIRFKDV